MIDLSCLGMIAKFPSPLKAMLQRWKPSAADESALGSESKRMIEVKDIVERIQEDEVEALEVMLRCMYRPDLTEGVACNGRLLLKVFTLSDR